MIEKGDHLKSSRGFYTHHGLYIGEGRVIHYSGLSDGIESGPIEEVSLHSFCSGHNYEIVKHENRKYTKEQSINYARSRLGENAYSVTGNNCEHFVNWCIDGDHKSTQIDVVAGVGVSVLSSAASIGSRAVVASVGSVTGLSGAGVMSGLATVGEVIGGGAIAGIGVLAGAGGVVGVTAAVLLNNTVLKDDENLDEYERESRNIGRKATYAGVAVGTAGSIASISAAGSVAGLSGAGITSGLAVIGGWIGGGMGAGLALTTVAPIAATATVGYGLYKAVKWFKN